MEQLTAKQEKKIRKLINSAVSSRERRKYLLEGIKLILEQEKWQVYNLLFFFKIKNKK